MKRLLAAMLTFSLLFAAPFQAHAAAGWPTYTIESNVSAVRGDTITLPITVSSNPGFTSVGFIVTYNPNVLEIVGVSQATAAMPLNSQFSLTTTPGSQWIHLVNTNLTDWHENGAVVNMSFKVKADAAIGTSPVYLAFTVTPDGTPANSSSNIINDARVVSGSVDVSGSDDGGANTKYPVIYHLNGGMGTAPAETDKAEGQRFYAKAVGNIIAPFGMQFKEWNTSSDGRGIWYWPGELITMPDSTLTLYAIWEDAPAGTGNDDTGYGNLAVTDNSGSDDGGGMDVAFVANNTGGNVDPNWLPQTGLLFWPIPVFGGIGVTMLVPCAMLLRRKK